MIVQGEDKGIFGAKNLSEDDIEERIQKLIFVYNLKLISS